MRDPARTLGIAGYLLLVAAAITFFIIPGIGLILVAPAAALFIAAFVVRRSD